MKVSAHAIATWVWLAIIMMVVPRTTLGYTTIKLDLAHNPTSSYPSVMTSLRNQLQGQLVCLIAVTKQTVTDDKRFVLVELRTSSTKYVTIAIDVLNVYVVGYNSNGIRANFLNDASTVARNKLWVGLPRRDTGFGGSYPDLERITGSRQNIALGFIQLRSAVESVIVKNPNDPVNQVSEAKFFIIAIQMVSEAARFKYIEKEVNVATNNGVKPNPKVLKLETSWDRISRGIQTSNPPCATIAPPLQLQNADGSQWIVDRVDQISPDMGLLKKPVSVGSNQFVESSSGEVNNDGDALRTY